MILAILSQESGFGANVGNCLVTDLTTGDGKGKNTGTPFTGVMKAPRDTVPFERITKALGKDWSTTPVSCPQPGGYGGAMGPTQFIPSTWALFEARLMAALNVPATNPWNAEHAIMAMGLYLADVGATGQTYTAERNAACSYYSGRPCPGTGGAVDTYGTSVVTKAAKYQQDIDFLKDN
jgi:membrane-bound lytic murein transglycosylase B